MENRLNAEQIKKHLPHIEDVLITVFDSIDSTNSEAKRVLKNGLAQDAIFVSHHQTQGRGRSGKSFFSPEDSGLYFSIVLHPETKIENAVLITVAAAVATREVIAEQTKKDPKIKWVNDIFIDDKKVCGILAEAVSDFEKGIIKSAVIGIGINVTTTDFPSELKGIASSLGRDINRGETVASIYKRLKSICETISDDTSFVDEYRKHSFVIGKTVSFTLNGVSYSAKAVDISDRGELVVRTDDGEQFSLNSGEVSIKF